MNPARSPITTGALPSRSANATTSVTTSGSVTTVFTISTSFSTGAGLKKCMPTTLPGRAVCTPISVIDNDDVLDTNTTSGRVILSSSVNTSAFSSRLSGIASITRSTSDRSDSEVLYRIRASSASRPASSSLPPESARSVECRRWPRPRSTLASSSSTVTTSSPLRASTSAIPAPIVPRPTTPTVEMSRAIEASSDVTRR